VVKAKPTAASKLKRRSDPAEVSHQRARLLAAQAERWRLRNAQAAGELVPAADVTREWTGICRLIRSRMLAVGQRHPEADQDIRQALAELAQDQP
jgi:phage terminase Nu1 subunit (DNA packaging protein)